MVCPTIWLWKLSILIVQMLGVGAVFSYGEWPKHLIICNLARLCWQFCILLTVMRLLRSTEVLVCGIGSICHLLVLLEITRPPQVYKLGPSFAFWWIAKTRRCIGYHLWVWEAQSRLAAWHFIVSLFREGLAGHAQTTAFTISVRICSLNNHLTN